MKSLPAWKKWLSYLWELHIESAPSEINPHLYVSLRKGRYQLCTANAVYSYDDLYNNFSDLFPQLEIEKLPGKKVLVLGFGLGSIPLILEKQYDSTFDITGVELDDSVIYLASKYTLPRLVSPVELICSHAGRFIEITKEQYDLIAIDIFIDDIIPEEFRKEEFLRIVQKRMSKGGLLIMNTLAANEKDRSLSDRLFNNTFLKVFPEGTSVSVPGNQMLISSATFLK